ncbi:MAG: DUF4870 domain-containing protein [Myxococcota bacterium]
MAAPSPSPGSSTGLDSNIAGALCYALGFITGIVFLVIEREDRDVRFHAYQSLGVFFSIFVVSVVAGWVPLIGWLIALLLTPVTVILWLVLMIKAFQGEQWRVPVVGDWAAEQADRS